MMNPLFKILSVLAVAVALSVMAGEKKDCAKCEKSKVGEEAKAECKKACDKAQVGEEAKSECKKPCDTAKVGEEAKSECKKACDKAKVGEEAKAECSKEKAECKNVKTLTFKVDGTNCTESCGKLDKILTSLDGVVKSASCSKSHLTKVYYDSTKVKPALVLASIKKAGYKVEGQQLDVAVKGMACKACSSKVGKVLTSLDGVINGSACHESNKAAVLFDPEKVKEEQIIAAINSSGFTASLE